MIALDAVQASLPGGLEEGPSHHYRVTHWGGLHTGSVKMLAFKEKDTFG